jgi:predicted phosphodiesterase
VVAVYDGKITEIYVNGKKESSGTEQSGDIFYPTKTPYVIGAYADSNELTVHHGRIREVKVYDLAAKAEWVAEAFSHHKQLAQEPAVVQPQPLEAFVSPYLQWATKNSMTVMWETNETSTSVVHYGETSACTQSFSAVDAKIHEVKIPNLKAQTQYFYRVESVTAAKEKYQSKVSTFQTAVHADSPFAFAVISDTQGNPAVSSVLANMAWAQRPNFLLHPGDLVSTGKNKDHWLNHFFPGMRPLIDRVAFFPVLGNHEQNADHYYNYVSLPEPEYYYTFQYGNGQFFMVDTNQNVGVGSKQYEWLKDTLEKSTATWKFVCHHHPPYSSDENDYGDLWKSNKSSRGDLRARVLVPLYEDNGVDIVWNGHIHSYERTWRIRRGKAVEKDGPFYMITGGGGGGLETPSPVRPFFQNNVRHGHHYVMVSLNGGTLEMKTFSLEGRMFDYLKITK